MVIRILHKKEIGHRPTKYAIKCYSPGFQYCFFFLVFPTAENNAAVTLEYFNLQLKKSLRVSCQVSMTNPMNIMLIIMIKMH